MHNIYKRVIIYKYKIVIKVYKEVFIKYVVVNL